MCQRASRQFVRRSSRPNSLCHCHRNSQVQPQVAGLACNLLWNHQVNRPSSPRVSLRHSHRISQMSNLLQVLPLSRVSVRLPSRGQLHRARRHLSQRFIHRFNRQVCPPCHHQHNRQRFRRCDRHRNHSVRQAHSRRSNRLAHPRLSRSRIRQVSRLINLHPDRRSNRALHRAISHRELLLLFRQGNPLASHHSSQRRSQVPHPPIRFNRPRPCSLLPPSCQH
jgi:hypothetical protein